MNFKNSIRCFSKFSKNKQIKLQEKATFKQNLIAKLSGPQWKHYPISHNLTGMRLDRFIKSQLPHLNQGSIQKGLRENKIGILHLNNEKLNRVTSNYNLKLEDRVFVRRSLLPTSEQIPLEKKDQFVPQEKWDLARSWVIWKDDDYIALNKPTGLACQGGSKQENHLGDYLPALKYELAEIPRLVHRLDKDTSGVLLLARSRLAAQRFSSLLKAHKIEKTYHAILVGRPHDSSGEVEVLLKKGRIGGQEKMILEEPSAEIQADHTWKKASMQFEVADKPSGPLACLIKLSPLTGRTHQLRVICARKLQAPIMGDSKYGIRTVAWKKLEGMAGIGKLPLCLHASSLSFVHPAHRSRKPILISAPFPPHIKTLLSVLKSNNKL